ncbi:hypothetical protein [Achromobacter sp. 413638]|jgi:predicted nucleic-acid-binding Zn-ribbon protein|uniref:hypothetical protein n=1 Tax=Achromobacter sp. 413638 TaxID=3342385 RepID=UPI003253D2F9
MKENDRQAKCTRCRNVHLESERVERPRPRRSTASIQMYDRCCPRCGSKEYYDMTPQVAWCWASGLIEIGDRQPADHADGSGAILIASGPKFALRTHLSDLARHGYGHSEGQLLVPGVPEADDQQQAGDALEVWLARCRRSRSARQDGVVFVLKEG